MIKTFLKENGDKYSKWLIDNHYGGIEYKILKYLQDIDNGVFVEAGAHDGIFQSTTKILEDLGWTGLLIEPSKNLYEKCKENRNSICEHYGLVSNEYSENTISGSLNSNLLKSNNGITLMGDKDEECPAITMTELCKKHNIYKIDFFTLDVEGYELEVLKGIDFNTVDINYFLIEAHTLNYKLEELTNYLSKMGFELICNLSNFNKENCPRWPGHHQDYLFKNKNYARYK